MPIITLTTDFGTRDGYVGAMKGVIARRAPDATVIDLAHDIPPGDIAHAAWVVSTSAPEFPWGAVHVVVVDPGEPLDKDIYDLEPEELAEVPKTPGSLEEALAALREDHQFLLRGDVFTPDVIDTWIWYKTEKEVDALRLRPHPYEFCMYYDI